MAGGAVTLGSSDGTLISSGPGSLMGTLWYGTSGLAFEFDDRTLVHLQVVITAKLRRREGFTFTWVTPGVTGGGRHSLWIHPSSTLSYRFGGDDLPRLNREWIEELMLSANSTAGLQFLPETLSPV
jgi:hypothetical protein